MHCLERLEDRKLFAGYAATTVAELITAIELSNSSAEADTITLPARATFSLAAPHNTENGGNGLPRVTGGGGMTIVGSAAATTVIERSGARVPPAFRLFDVAAGASLTLQNLTFQGGLASSPLTPTVPPAPSQGGAVYNAGTLALDGAIVQNNVAQGSIGTYAPWTSVLPGGDAAGGGVFSSGALTVAASTFLNNRAVGGRGFDAMVRRLYYGEATLSPATAGGNAYGGGIYVAGGQASVSGSTLTANTAAGGDGGNGYGSTNHAGAVGGNGLGGGVFAAGGTVELRTFTVTRNAARGGLGGVDALTGVRSASGLGTGGGIYVGGARIALDAFTVSHLIDNTASTSSPNIAGSYKRLR